MKVLLVNGSSRKEGCTHAALREVERSLKEEGIGTEMFCIWLSGLFCPSEWQAPDIYGQGFLFRRGSISV